jgi:photosystem II stability/assembly factor-like uncharacterized protein
MMKRSLIAVILTALVVSCGGVIWMSSSAYAEDEGSFNGEDDGEFSDGDSSSSSDVAADNTATASISSLGPYGGNLWDAAVDATNGYVYTVAKDSPNGFYYSTDSGTTWSGLSSDVDYGGSTAIELDTTTGDVYVVFANGTYKSTDHGTTFTKVSEDTSIGLLYAQDTLMLGSNHTPGAMQISTDQGTTFNEVMVASEESIWSLASSPTTGTFYAVTSAESSSQATHLYQTTNSGSSWSEITIPTIADAFVETHVCVNPTDANHIIITGGYNYDGYQSLNGGSSWAAISPQSVGCTFDSTGRIYIGGQYSDDKGTSWSSMGLDENDDNTAIGGHNLTVDPSDVNILYADGMPGISKSTDRGTTWTDINEGIKGVTISDVSQAADKDIVWAAAYNGIAKTTNFTSGTPTWIFPVLPDPGTAIWVNPTDPTIVVVGEIGAIKRTTDGGTTWSDNLASALTHSFSPNEIIQDVTDSNTLYAAVMTNEPNQSKTGMVLKSTDLGATWETMNLLDDASAQTIAQAPNGDLYVGAGSPGGISYKTGVYKYSTGTWEYLTGSPDEEIVRIAVDPNDENTIFAVASIEYGNNDSENFGFYKSTDAGVTWTKKTEGLENNREYSSLTIQSSTTPTTLYLGAANFKGQGVLYKSSDAGDTWGTLYTGLKDETYYTLLFDGLEAGTSRGLFDLKSQASLVMKAMTKKIVGGKATIKLTLKDGVTDKKLKRQTIKLYKKSGKKFVQIGKAKTNAKGVITTKVKAKPNTTLQAQWTPTEEDSNEYDSTTSKNLKIKR